MLVFVTGATGFVGSAVVQDLLRAGHQVLGLARSEAGASALTAAGASVQRGTLEDLDALRAAAAQADGVVHTGFNHDFSKFAASCELDRRAIEALGDALAGSDRPLVITSGVAHIAPGRLATEADPPPATSAAYPRQSEAAAAAQAARGVRAMTVRLPPSVHGVGDHGFVPMLVGIAREAGVSVYRDGGTPQRWPAVHRLDAAPVYRLALERGTAGARYHAIAEEGVPFAAIAEVIGRRLGVPVEARSAEACAAHFGWFAGFATMDVPTSSERTRAVLGWSASQPGLLADIDQAAYFA